MPGEPSALMTPVNESGYMSGTLTNLNSSLSGHEERKQQDEERVLQVRTLFAGISADFRIFLV